MVYHWIKWRWKIRIKDQYRSRFLTPYLSWKWLLAWGIMKAVLLFAASYVTMGQVILNGRFEIGSNVFYAVVDHLIKAMREEPLLIWSVLYFVIFLDAIVSGMSTARRQKQSLDGEWLQMNVKLTPSRARIMVEAELLLWESKKFLMVYIPIMAAVQSYFPAPLITMVFAWLFYLVFGFLAASYYGLALSRQATKQSFFIRMTCQLALRIAFLVLSVQFARKLVPWVEQFPLISKTVEKETFFGWLDTGSASIVSMTSSIAMVFNWRFWPHNLLAELATGNGGLPFLTGLLVAGVLLYLPTRNHSDTKRSWYPFTFYEKWISFLLILSGGKGHMQFMTRNDLRSTFFLSRFPIIMGPFSFWIFMGLIWGFLDGIDHGSKMFHMVLSFYTFYFVYFYTQASFSALNGIHAMDGVGKRVQSHLHPDQGIWPLLRLRLRLFLAMTVPLLVVGDVIMITLVKPGVTESIILFLSHLCACMLFSLIMYLPSVLTPHFHYPSLEELEDYPDQEKIRNMTSGAVVGVMIPMVFMLPCAFYLTDSLSYRSYLWVIGPGLLIVMVLFIFGLLFAMYRRLSRMTHLDHLNL
ncbi:hypothetical protein [Rossellomorea marisflavi]|uniref:hypothetical protein n=1 Tax=Rossellomorea marisflavi TaxID=189381 RepID=UPI001BCA1356|nr:hypothetical protein [Rossellomorea marisflavi]